MQMQTLINALPPFKRQRDIIIWGRQKLKDIKEEMLQAHERYALDYDYIAKYFTSNAPRELFDFVQQNLIYKPEIGQDQTTRSPSAILQSNSVDCKQIAGFIAGVLSALQRKGYDFDWYYRFASYAPKKAFDHVFVVVNGIWVDPTPIKDKKSGQYVTRSFNDRLAKPVRFQDLNNFDMLSTIHGVHYTVGPENNGQCSVGQTTASTMTALAAVDPQAAAVVSTAKDVLTFLPDGGFKDWMNSFLSDPAGAIVRLFTGRKYTSGDYHLGEVYMRNILGMQEIQRRGQVPDAYVPQAWSFFTLAMGVPISSHDHLANLAISAAAYKSWANNFFGWVPNDQAERAHKIITTYLGWTAETQDVPVRDVRWAIAKFGAIPYIWPMWDVYDGHTQVKFTGQHPVLGISFENGYPYVVPGTGTGSGTGTGTGSGTGTGTGSGTGTGTGSGDNTKKAGFSTGQMLLIGGIAAGALIAFNQPKKKHH